MPDEFWQDHRALLQANMDRLERQAIDVARGLRPELAAQTDAELSTDPLLERWVTACIITPHILPDAWLARWTTACSMGCEVLLDVGSNARFARVTPFKGDIHPGRVFNVVRWR
jgi:hypothetical protein